MSQFWHAHWCEDAFKPKKLQNWEVPRWHAEWPNRHCQVTKAEAQSNGRVSDNFKKPKNPWSKFQGTWELPLKIDRQTAEKLSRFTEYKKSFWRAQKIKHEAVCNAGADSLCKYMQDQHGEFSLGVDPNEDAESITSFKKCVIKKTCIL